MIGLAFGPGVLLAAILPSRGRTAADSDVCGDAPTFTSERQSAYVGAATRRSETWNALKGASWSRNEAARGIFG
jgi:hypothetical protein